MEEMGSLGPLLVQLGALMTWAGLEMPKGIAVHERVKHCKAGQCHDCLLYY